MQAKNNIMTWVISPHFTDEEAEAQEGHLPRAPHL